jgi:hypothetical protein
VLTAPDQEEQQAAWLESELSGPQLPRLVIELAALAGVEPRTATSEQVDQWLDERRTAVLSEGLAGLAPESVRQLLGSPEFLLPLQQLLLIEGGAYWQAKFAAGADDDSRRQQQLRLLKIQQTLEAESVRPAASPHTDQLSTVEPSAISPRRGLVLLLLAASILLVVGGSWLLRSPTGPPWGWTAAEMTAMADLPADQYLERLATGGGKWFAKRPDTKAGLAKRIREMRAGCDLVIDTNRQAAPTPTRQWLIERCLAWREKFDEQLLALENGAEVGEVRDRMDALVNKLVNALRERAGQLAESRQVG